MLVCCSRERGSVVLVSRGGFITWRKRWGRKSKMYFLVKIVMRLMRQENGKLIWGQNKIVVKVGFVGIFQSGDVGSVVWFYKSLQVLFLSRVIQLAFGRNVREMVLSVQYIFEISCFFLCNWVGLQFIVSSQIGFCSKVFVFVFRILRIQVQKVMFSLVFF